MATPITTQPAKAIAQPPNSRGGNPSFRKIPASRAIRIGPVLISIAAVPALIRRSAAFSEML